jgi:hypothetical protein
LYPAYCEFEDEEAVLAVLVDSVRVEEGSKGLSLQGHSFDSSEKFGDFMNALRGNTYLERLDHIGNLHVRYGSFQALVAVLPENRGLTHLGLTGCTVNAQWRDQLMGATAEHPSLQTFSFEEVCDENEGLFLERHEPIHALAGILAENEQVDEIEVADPFDRVAWNAVAVPSLEIN